MNRNSIFLACDDQASSIYLIIKGIKNLSPFDNHFIAKIFQAVKSLIMKKREIFQQFKAGGAS